jgi:hypothetical protein
MSMFKLPSPPTDPRADRMRARMRQGNRPKDLAGKTMRLALHLSDWEALQLEVLNRETLGSPDQGTRTAAWALFVSSPESLPYRVNKV